MDTKQKTRAGVAGGLAALALVIGGVSIASGDTTTTSPPSTPAASQNDGHRDHPCPKDERGSGTQEQRSAPSESSSGTTPPSL